MKVTVIVPVRYGSTRLPAKMTLRDPRGKCVFEYVCAAAARARSVSRVIAATDDERIMDIARAAGIEAWMTSPAHTCGSDRIAEVAAQLDSDIIVNAQGDEPRLRPEMVDQVVELLEPPDAVMSTLACPIEDEAEYRNPNVVKVVTDGQGRALYFSRAPIPFARDIRDAVNDSPVKPLHHIGIYGFRRDFLLEYTRLPKTPLEVTEKLEQLRVLYHGRPIHVGVTPYRLLGIDTPEDFETFCQTVREEMRGET